MQTSISNLANAAAVVSLVSGNGGQLNSDHCGGTSTAEQNNNSSNNINNNNNNNDNNNGNNANSNNLIDIQLSEGRNSFIYFICIAFIIY